MLKIWENADSLEPDDNMAIIGNGHIAMGALDNGQLPAVTILSEEVKIDVPIDIRLRPHVTGANDHSTNAMIDYSSGVLTKSICAQIQNKGRVRTVGKI